MFRHHPRTPVRSPGLRAFRAGPRLVPCGSPTAQNSLGGSQLAPSHFSQSSSRQGQAPAGWWSLGHLPCTPSGSPPTRGAAWRQSYLTKTFCNPWYPLTTAAKIASIGANELMMIRKVGIPKTTSNEKSNMVSNDLGIVSSFSWTIPCWHPDLAGRSAAGWFLRRLRLGLVSWISGIPA